MSKRYPLPFGGEITEDPSTWKKRRERRIPFNQATLLITYLELGKPKSFFDVGCGIGNLVKLSAALGIPSVGCDALLPSPEFGDHFELAIRDLTKSFNMSEEFDLVLCQEVAEHIPKEFAEQLITTISNHAKHRVIFTAAPPGQSGDGHVNCQYPEYWREKFLKNGLNYASDETEKLRKLWELVCGPCWWYPQNIQVFLR